MYKISVIIPVFNCEKYLEKCLDSVLSQTLNDIQIILIDDGSTDNSLEIIKKYANKHSNIIYKTKSNEGQAIARNLGIEMANGEFICFVDSDDYIEKDMLETLYQNGIENKSDIIICDYFEDYENKNIYKKSLYIDEGNLIKSYMVCVAGPCSKIIKTDLIKRNNLKFLENNIYEDLAIIPTLGLYTNNISYCQKPFYHYVIRTNSTMQQTKYNEKIESIFNVMNYLYENFDQKGYNEELEFLYINHLLYAGCGRFLKYKNTDEMISKIINTINSKFPNWKNNKYFKKQSTIYKLTCNIFMRNKKFEIALYKLFRRII
ncbi:MAG: glycosyltransferase [Clostridia bacterium]|nr:glycosyltransferase [Clostridia bacterium]